MFLKSLQHVAKTSCITAKIKTLLWMEQQWYSHGFSVYYKTCLAIQQKLKIPQKLGTDGMIDKGGNNKIEWKFWIFFAILCGIPLLQGIICQGGTLSTKVKIMCI